MTYLYDKDLSVPGWEIKIDALANYGYWENTTTGAGGSVWFIGLAMVAGDAVPVPVVNEIVKAGYIIDPPFHAPPAPPVNLDRRK